MFSVSRFPNHSTITSKPLVSFKVIAVKIKVCWETRASEIPNGNKLNKYVHGKTSARIQIICSTA